MATSLVPLLETSEFQELLRLASRAPLLRRELTSDLVPEGYSEDAVWDALTAIRRSQAYYSPNICCGEEGIQRNWYTLPASLLHSLRQLAKLTHKGSELYAIIEERRSSRFITQEYLQEILVNLGYDGYDPDYESIRSVVLGERACATVAEKLAVNYHQISQNLDEFCSGQFDRALLMDIYGRLTAGIADEEFAAAPARQLLTGFETKDHAEYVLDIIAAIGNNTMAEPTLHPIMVSMLVNCRFWRCLPFDQCNNLMGSLTSRLYLLREGFPVFRYLPKTSIIDEWKRGGRLADVVDYTFEESTVTVGTDADWTAYYDSVMKLMVHSLTRTQKTLQTIKDSDDVLLALVDHLAEMNYRQRMLLHQAIVCPGIEFYIAPHGRKHNIVYSTARTDLEQLVERGFLTRTVHDSANTYQAAPRLHEVLHSETGSWTS